MHSQWTKYNPAKADGFPSQVKPSARAAKAFSAGAMHLRPPRAAGLLQSKLCPTLSSVPDQPRPGMTLTEIEQLQRRRENVNVGGFRCLSLLRPLARLKIAEPGSPFSGTGESFKFATSPSQGGWLAIHQDRAELEATRAVEDERISLQALIDVVPDYLWVKDLESRFVVVNRALATD